LAGILVLAYRYWLIAIVIVEVGCVLCQGCITRVKERRCSHCGEQASRYVYREC
ncbi:unnamed protein product, partial [marine sediment metagenome]